MPATDPDKQDRPVFAILMVALGLILGLAGPWRVRKTAARKS
jgi:hypothetical protein